MMDKQAALRAQIEALITQEVDSVTKAILLTIMNLQEDLGEHIDELAKRIDGMRGDIPGLKQAVLNGHAEVHHNDHEWLAKLRARMIEIDPIITWAKAKIEEEKESVKENRKAAIGAKWRIYERIIWGLAVFWLFSKAFPGAFS